MIELTASDGHKLAAYRAEPSGTPPPRHRSEGSGPWAGARGGIVVVQEIFGVNAHIRRVTDGFAAEGYVAIAPALFDRIERDVELPYTAVPEGRALKVQITTEMAMRDLDAAIRAVAPAGKVGIVGYCWGGFITWMASAHAHGLACAVPYYGGGMLENMDIVPRVPVMGHFGDRDTILPIDKVKELIAKHPQQQFFIYEADHGFNCEDRGSYDEPAAKLARERTLAFFRKHVG